MRKGKKFLSMILASLMMLSSFAVGFNALAAELAEAEESSAVSEVSDAITAFHSNGYNTLMFKDEEAEKKAEAVKAFDEICAEIKSLTDTERAELSVSNYVYILALAADSIGREAGLKSNYAKVYGIAGEGFAKITEKLGALPAEYQKGYDALKVLYVKVGKTLFNSSFDFLKESGGYAHFEACMEIIKTLSPKAVRFANYATAYDSAFYLYCSKPTDSSSSLSSNLISITYNYYQDKMSSTGKDPSISFSTFVKHDYKTNTNTYQGKYNGATYKAAYEAYYELLLSDTVAPSRAATEKLAELFSAIYGSSFADALNTAAETGLAYYTTGSITTSEINRVLDKINVLSGDAAAVFASVASSYKIKIAAKNIYPIEYTEETSADDVYNNQIKTETKTIQALVDSLKDVLTQLQLDEFINNVKSADLNNLSNDEIETVKSQYSVLPAAFKNKIDLDTYTKFMQIVKPAADSYDFSKEIAEFKSIPVNRGAVGGQVIMTAEGIQNSADGTWELVKALLNLAGVNIDLSNGLNNILEDNLYQVSVINAVFDLYATLSHNETETGVSLAPTLGAVISMLISTGSIANLLVQDDNRYKAAVEQIKAIKVTDEEKAQGINALDKLAGIEFTDKDFGFVNGDRDGFIDALLAALRPITLLLAGDNAILGIAKVYINMFDSVDEQGNYGNNGIYAMLLPMLEQLGLTDLPTPIEYRENYYSVRASMGKNIAYDEILRCVINSLFDNAVQPVADDPLNGLVKILPRLAYVVSTNMVDETVKAVIASTGDTLAGLAGSLDLSAKAINNMLAGIEINLSGSVIRFKPVNWSLLADCCIVSAVESKSNSNEYFMLRTGDVDSCFTNIFYYIYDVIFADKGNYKAIKSLLNSALDGALLSIVNNIIDTMAYAGKLPAYEMFLAWTAETGKTSLPAAKPFAQNKFKDLAGFEAYDDYVAYTSVYNSFIMGTNASVFSPKADITRAMLVTILYRMAGSPYDGANPYKINPFSDVRKDAYYYNAVCWALDEGITNQISFRPNDKVTREQTARFLFAYAQANDMLGSDAYKSVDLGIYPDSKSVSSWAKEPMQWANYNNMITGTQQGFIYPKGSTQRIHAARILYGFGKACNIGSFK